jgi:hypothetical protein
MKEMDEGIDLTEREERTKRKYVNKKGARRINIEKEGRI